MQNTYITIRDEQLDADHSSAHFVCKVSEYVCEWALNKV